eukprot:Pgem_evm1s13585
MITKEKKSIGEAFGTLTPSFKQVFSDYSSNFHMATKLLSDNLEKEKTFREFTDKAEAKPQFNNSNVGALLLTPVQRPPRYKLLLEGLLNELEQDDVDYKNIKKAFDAMKQCVSDINEQIRQLEEITKILENL